MPLPICEMPDSNQTANAPDFFRFYYCPARESRRSLNIYMEACSISAERSLVSLNMICSPSLESLTMTCGPYLKCSNILISDAC